MVDRRRWLAAAASLAAGLFTLPGRAAAGGFRRGRCHAPPCCPHPAHPCHGCCTPYFDCPPINHNLPYNHVTAVGGVIVTECCRSGLTVVLTLHSHDPQQFLFSDHLTLTQVGCTNHYTWPDYKFPNVMPPPDTLYRAMLSAQAFNCDGKTCGTSTGIPITITKG